MSLLRQNQSFPRFFLLLTLVSISLAAISWWWARLSASPDLSLAQGYILGETTRAGASTDRIIEGLQTRLRSDSGDWQAYSQLGLAYLQKAREAGDPAYYQNAQGVLEKALSIEPGDYAATGAMGALALARHQFHEALEWGERARGINPYRSFAYGVIADSQVELGLYEDAAQTVQAMVDLRPDMGSYSRASYLRELFGDLEGALELMQWAVDSGIPHSEMTAWTRAQLGNLYFNSGDLERAEQEYGRTLADFPGYVYALAGLGRVRLAQGRDNEGIDFLLQASRVMPIPEFIITLADFYTVNGQPKSAQEQVDLLRAIQKLYEANGVDMDLEIALFNADHDIDLVATLVQARRAYARRPSIYAADVLAWCLYKSGEYAQARAFSDQALRLGTRDALKLFHAGMIHYQLGNFPQARRYLESALGVNPHFSILYSQVARRTLEVLKSGLIEE